MGSPWRHGLATACLAACCLIAMPGSGRAGNALCPAAAEGDVNALRRLLIQSPDLINQYGADGLMPLHAAVQGGHRNAVLLLIASGADINAREKESGLTPLLMAIIGNHPSVVQALVSQGADVNAAANQGATPLHMAAYLGQRSVLEYLVARGADINAVNQAGITPIEWALSNDQREAANILAAAGARLPKQPAAAPADTAPPAATVTNVPTPTPQRSPETSLQMEIEEAAQWIAELQVQLNQTRATLQEVRAQLTTEIANRQQTVTNLESRLQEASSNAELYRKRYESAVLEKLDSLQKLRDETAKARAIHDELLTQLTAKLNATKTRLAQTEKQLAEAQTRLTQSDEQLAESNLRSRAWEIQTQTVASEQQAAHQKYADRSKQLAVSEQRRQAAEKMADRLEADLLANNAQAARALDAVRRECAQKLLTAEQESVRLKERILRMGANLQEISRRLRLRESESPIWEPAPAPANRQ